MIAPGIYTGTLENYAINNTKDGNPQVCLLFGIDDSEGAHHQLTWFGTLKEGKGREITLKTVLACGLKGNDLSALAAGAEGGALTNGIKMSLDVEHHSYNGKTTAKIKWVNALGGAAFQKALTVQEAKTKISLLNLSGELAMLRGQNGSATTTQTQETFYDLPF